MYVSVALLADEMTQRLVDQIRQELGVSVATLPRMPLPAHLSLKQPFVCKELAPVEAWLERLASSLSPIEIALERLYHGQYEGQGILGLAAAETACLRALHNRINAELLAVVADPAAPFDGDAYRFHVTVAMGPLGVDNPYRRYHDAMADPHLDHIMFARQLALFVCAGALPTPQDWRLYRSLTLGAPPPR